VKETRDRENRPLLSSQPYEALTITLRGKYFFDPFFGGALLRTVATSSIRSTRFPGLFTAAFRDASRRSMSMRVIVRDEISSSISELISTRRAADAFAVDDVWTFAIAHSDVSEFLLHARDRAGGVSRVCRCAGFEAGTVRGSQWSPAVFLGNRERGCLAARRSSSTFQKRPGRGDSSLISSTVTLGHIAWDCCAVAASFRPSTWVCEKRTAWSFSFRLNGIGSFGTEQIGQRILLHPANPV
jgi:hypothetical protein